MARYDNRYVRWAVSNPCVSSMGIEQTDNTPARAAADALRSAAAPSASRRVNVDGIARPNPASNMRAEPLLDFAFGVLDCPTLDSKHPVPPILAT